MEYLSTQVNVEVSIFSVESLIIDFCNGEFIIKNKAGTILDMPDFVIPRTSYDKALNFYITLEAAGVKFLNSPYGIFLCRHKWRALVTCSRIFNQPNTTYYPESEIFAKKVFAESVVVENPVSSRGRGVWLLESEKDIQKVKENVLSNEELLTQEFISESKGKDLRVLIIGNEIIGAIKKTSETDLKPKVSEGAEAEVFIDITRELRDSCMNIMKELNLNYAGIDFLFDTGELKLCEVNWGADFEVFEKVTGINVPEAVFKFIVRTINK
jgi:ribosomal protein S6--L-glutamate ligase/gamma-F420-2:alpha-L-glutamate ligase